MVNESLVFDSLKFDYTTLYLFTLISAGVKCCVTAIIRLSVLPRGVVFGLTLSVPNFRLHLSSVFF